MPEDQILKTLERLNPSKDVGDLDTADDHDDADYHDLGSRNSTDGAGCLELAQQWAQFNTSANQVRKSMKTSMGMRIKYCPYLFP